jgi:hypothetical protein
LTESKADEYGRAVHENCYVSMLVSKNPRRFTVRIDALRERLSLLSVLNSTNQESQMKLNIRKAIWIFALAVAVTAFVTPKLAAAQSQQ